MTTLNEVFGVSSKQVLSYIERENIDSNFKHSLASGNHIVVYGASKQGKTALVSRYVPYNKNIVIRLTPDINIPDVYASILRQAGIEIEISHTDESSSNISANFGMKATAKIPLLTQGEANASSKLTSTDKSTKHYQSIPFNLQVAQDISEMLQRIKFNQKIILENFHYLDEEKQRKLSYDLRTFQETGIIFIILGVWRKKDKLRIYCPDLTDRVDDIPIEPWMDSDFMKVAKKGEEKLNISIAESIISKLVTNSFGSIGVFQELLKSCCEAASIYVRNEGEVYYLDNEEFADTALDKKSQEYSESHQQSLELLASGNVSHAKGKDKIPLYLPYYLVRCILSQGYESIRNGLSRPEITDSIKKIHHRPDDIRSSDMSNLLHNLSGLQFKKGLNPPLVDYDRGQKQLFAIDSTFFYFLKNSDLKEFEEELPSPIDID